MKVDINKLLSNLQNNYIYYNGGLAHQLKFIVAFDGIILIPNDA